MQLSHSVLLYLYIQYDIVNDIDQNDHKFNDKTKRPEKFMCVALFAANGAATAFEDNDTGGGGGEGEAAPAPDALAFMAALQGMSQVRPPVCTLLHHLRASSCTMI